MTAPSRTRTCTTGKARFETRERAETALRRIWESHESWSRAYIPSRVQNESCTRCEGYHLTSNDNKPPRAGKRTVGRRRPKQRGKGGNR